MEDAQKVEELKEETEQNPTAANCNELGAIYLDHGDLLNAERALLKAVKIDPEYKPLYRNMMMLYGESGNSRKALEWGSLALQAEPESRAVKMELMMLLSMLEPRAFQPDLHWMVYEVMGDKTIDSRYMQHVWRALLKLSPAFGAFYKKCKLKDYKAFCKSVGKIGSFKALSDPFFLRGLETFLVPDYEFEMFLTYVRRYLSAHVNEPLTGLDGMKQMDVLMALSSYCYRTEYIFYASDEEQAWLSAMQKQLETQPEEASLLEVLMLSCYMPLHSLANAEDIDSCFGGAEEFDEFLQLQILDHKEQQAAKKKIETLTAIDDETSGKVQAQYEAFPYPRWETLAQDASSESYVAFLGEELMAPLLAEGAKILIAGCGTGQQALEYGIAFPHADVTALDLSLTSLSYAQWRKDKFKVPNVRFYQGDILKLGEVLKPEYDLIVSTGVLHHMADPEAGWQVLSRLLKPSGLMRIALYSEAARQFIVRGREIIAKKGFGDDDAEIRRFRYEGQANIKKGDLTLMHQSEDFFSLSECRDMLFHVQEQRFDTTRLQDAIDICDLEFLKFEQVAPLKDTYTKMFPDDPDMRDLRNWDKFEQKFPLTFLNMYRFWCVKEK